MTVKLKIAILLNIIDIKMRVMGNFESTIFSQKINLTVSNFITHVKQLCLPANIFKSLT